MTGLAGPATSDGFRSGFCSIVGRPNAGKSTLVNQILRRKVAITSPRPQTTRNAIRGVLTTDSAQVVFVDTPGLHKPRSVLGERLNDVVRRTLREVDCLVFVVDASKPIARGDAFVAEQLAGIDTPVLVAVNKVDVVNKVALAQRLAQAAALGDFDVYRPISARTGDGVAGLVDDVLARLPEGPMYYPPDMVTDQPERILVGELIREKILELTREEVPHSVAVVVEEMEARGGGGDLVDVDAVVYVERQSQKGIVIGAGGRTLREVGTRARREIEPLLGNHVFLRLRVKVERDWQKRAGSISRFGYAT